MDRQRIGQSHGTTGYHSQRLHAMHEHLPLRGMPLCSNDGRVRWTDRLVAMTAILTTWTPAGSLREAFAAAREVVVSMYVSRRRPGRSIEGFLAALQRSSDDLVERIAISLRQSLRQIAGTAWRWNGYVVMAVDGSRIDCPRTSANEEAFGCAGRHKTAPQQFLTTIFHVATGLIWAWRKGRGDASERGHLRQMLTDLPQSTLLLMDAGYSGYDLLSAVQAQGQDFIVRVGCNVMLLRKLGWFVREWDNVVYLWPQAYRDRPPLVLRKMDACRSRHPMCLLTSVLSEQRLSDSQVAQAYRRGWLVEVRFRGLKQTLAKRKMLSDAPHKAQVELDWAVVGLAMLGLMAAQEQRCPSARWSVARALHAIRRAMRCRWTRPTAGGLQRQLRLAVVDRYIRRGDKRSRDWPHKKNETLCGYPVIRTATRSEVDAAQELRQCKLAG